MDNITNNISLSEKELVYSDILKEEIEFALRELADYKPSDYYPEEYVDIEEDDLLSMSGTEGDIYEE